MLLGHCSRQRDNVLALRAVNLRFTAAKDKPLLPCLRGGHARYNALCGSCGLPSPAPPVQLPVAVPECPELVVESCPEQVSIEAFFEDAWSDAGLSALRGWLREEHKRNLWR